MGIFQIIANVGYTGLASRTQHRLLCPNQLYILLLG